MMNVRVRRCRTKKIGVATGPEEITYPATTPKAIAANRIGVRPGPGSQTRVTPHVRTTSASSATFCGAMIPRQKVEAGTRPAAGGGAMTARKNGGGNGGGDGGRPGVRSVRTGPSSSPRIGSQPSSQPRVEQFGQSRIDQGGITAGGLSSPRSAQSSPSGGMSGVSAAPWHMQQDASHGGGGQMVPSSAVSMPV